MKYAVSEEGIAALHSLSKQITECAKKAEFAAKTIQGVFGDNAEGLGSHSVTIKEILENVALTQKEIEEPVELLCEKLEDLAESYQDALDNEYFHTGAGHSDGSSHGNGSGSGGTGNAGYHSPYVKTTEDTTVTFTNPETGCQETTAIHRTVYENSNIDPTMVIPAGTKFANGRVVQKDTTNLELMEDGKAPFVPVKGTDGSIILVPVELHHLDGRETSAGAEYFTGSKHDGSMAEIASTVHGAYSGILHIGGHSSFRVDADGNKTRDSAKYEAYRKKHWKERARKFRGNIPSKK